MRLSDLINGATGGAGGTEDLEIRGLAADSREVEDGYLFVALEGQKACGADYISDALRHGAVAVLAPPGTALPPDQSPVQFLTDVNPRRRLALMAARFYPEQPRTIAAVTGTNGKTSVCVFTRQIWSHAGHNAASLGSLGITAAGYSSPLRHTTPDPVALHRALSELVDHGVDHLAMEASSHGLDQCRLDGVRLSAAAFTNLSRDHFDYHADAASYLAAKQRLFNTVMAEGGVAVLPADVPEFDTLAEICRRRGHGLVTYGERDADIRLCATRPLETGQQFTLALEGTRHEVESGLAGRFQAFNLLAALGLAIATGVPSATALDALPALRGAPGRLQLVARCPNGAPVFVDYAHTPDALATVLRALRPHAKGRLVVLFGCGGDRDTGKRPLMGAAAAELADSIIVTDDNPRTEAPAPIRAAILEACPDALEIAERGEAIREAIAGLGAGDVALLAGKGHETGQIVGNEIIPFDDAEVARRAVRRLGGSRS